jgi:hypothetical protein
VKKFTGRREKWNSNFIQSTFHSSYAVVLESPNNHFSQGSFLKYLHQDSKYFNMKVSDYFKLSTFHHLDKLDLKNSTHLLSSFSPNLILPKDWSLNQVIIEMGGVEELNIRLNQVISLNIISRETHSFFN